MSFKPGDKIIITKSETNNWFKVGEIYTLHSNYSPKWWKVDELMKRPADSGHGIPEEYFKTYTKLDKVLE